MKYKLTLDGVYLTPESEDVGRTFRVWQPGADPDGEPLQMEMVESAQESEPWERLAQDLIRDAREGMVDIVTASCYQGLVISLWQGEAMKRLHAGLAMGIQEAKL